MDLKVLVLEDDEQVQNHLKSLLDDFGIHRVKYFDNVQNFQFELSLEKYHLLIIDCLLPGSVGGLDVLQKIEKPEDYSIWLMSGVIGKHSIKDKALLSKIDLFLKKPLKADFMEPAIQKIKNNLDKHFDDEGVLSSLYKSSFQASEFQRFVKKYNLFKGPELGLLMCLCSLSKWTGKVVLLEEEKQQKAVLTFLRGNLNSIQSPDQRSYFGVLAGLHGLVPSSVVKKLIAEEGGEPIGEKLVRLSYISPHSIHFILEEQTKIRLSSLMDVRKSYRVSLEEDSNILERKDFVSLSKIRSFISEILWPQVDVKWLKSFFESKNNIILQLGLVQDTSKISQHWRAKCCHILECIHGRQTFAGVKKQAQTQLNCEEDEVLFCFYYLLTTKYIYFDENKEEKKNRQDIESKIMLFQKALKKKNYFDLIGLSKNSSFSEIKERLLKMTKVFHPDFHSESMQETCNNILSHLNVVSDVLLDDEERKLYIDKLEKKTGDKFFQLFSQYEEAKDLLKENSFQKGLDRLQKIKDESCLPPDVKLYYAWAWIKTKAEDSNRNEMNNMLKFIERVDLELKYTSLYYFVRALYAFESGDVFIAEQHIEKSLRIDNQFLPARIESVRFKKQSKKSKFMAGLFKAS